jgi:hypothetical protein
MGVQVGRVIRHKKDFGAVLLCDERFLRWRSPTSSSLSKWIRPGLQARSAPPPCARHPPPLPHATASAPGRAEPGRAGQSTADAG